jgi:hypothetical protein
MKKIYILLVALSIANSLFAQSIFDNPITGTNTSAANPYTAGQTVDPNITVTGIGRGPGTLAANSIDSYNANNWNNGGAIDLTDYFTFTLTPNAGKAINFVSFVFTLQRSNQGPVNIALRSSVDAFTANIGSPATSTGSTLNTISLSGASYQNITTAIEFRIYGWNSTNNGGALSVNDFTFNGVTGTVLPVKLNYFNGAKQGNIFSLNWLASCSNTTGAGFTIERSSDGRNFTAINSFTASSTRCLQPFEYIDNSPLAGKNFYRLKMTEDNGKTIYSSIIILLNAETGFDIVGLLPSLVKTNAVLNVTSAQKTKLNVVVTDFAGRALQQQAFNLVAGSNQLGMNFANLAAGAYQITGVTTNGEKTTVRFIKQ